VGDAVQSDYAESFEREMGCTETEWLGWLPAAIGAHAWQRRGASVQVEIGSAGSLSLGWRVAAPRVIALMRIPRLIVHFRFSGMDAAQRLAFMKRFDLYMQRGGG
jgi:hypothetical protein